MRIRVVDLLPGARRNSEIESTTTFHINLAEEMARGKCMSLAERNDLDSRVASFSNGRQLGSESPLEVLEELFELLEDYGPAWYTEKVHDRALAALISAQCLGCTQNDREINRVAESCSGCGDVFMGQLEAAEISQSRTSNSLNNLKEQ